MDDVPDRIEHTVLGPETRWDDVEGVLATAQALGTRACIPPAFVERAAEWNETADGMADETADGVADETADKVANDTADRVENDTRVPLATVIDFPHGQGSTQARCETARLAWDDGADELDVVVNVGRVLAGHDATVRSDLEEVVASVPIPVKVIVESPLLDPEALHRVGEIAVDADVDYLKTATGFSEGGATVAAVEALAEYRPVKASGGIGSWERARAMFDAGAERIGASSGDVIVREWKEATGRT